MVSGSTEKAANILVNKFHGLKLYLFAEGTVVGLSRFVDGYIRSTMTFSIFRLVQAQKSLKTPESGK